MRENRLTAEDLVCLDCKYNDPEVSFFTMLRTSPHGGHQGRTEEARLLLRDRTERHGLDAVDFGA